MSDRFEDVTRRVPLLERAAWHSARRYVAGEEQSAALALVARLEEDGIAASVDFFGEHVADAKTARTAADSYVELAKALDDGRSAATVAVDLSHVGLDLSVDFCREQVERIADALGGRRLDVGAEDSVRTTATQGIVVGLAEQGVPLQMTLQANLRRTPEDWPALVDAGVAIRLVKGAFVESRTLARPYGDETDLAYLRLAREMHRGGAQLALASHDPVLRESLLNLESVSVEMLLGIRSNDALELTARGVPVRVYVPYGRDWFRYWMRRVAESEGA